MGAPISCICFMHTFTLLHIKLMHVKSNIKFQTIALTPLNTHTHTYACVYAVGTFCHQILPMFHAICQYMVGINIIRAPFIQCIHKTTHTHTEILTAFTLPMKNLCKFNISKVRCFNLKIYLWLFCNRDKNTHTHIANSDRI